MKALLLVPLFMAVTHHAHATIIANVEPYNSVCQVAQPCQVGAVHSLRIINDTPQPQKYDWFYSVQAVNGDVVNKHGSVTLQPKEEWRQDKVKNIGYMKFNIRGRKVLTNTTQADGYEHNASQKTSWADVN